MAEIKKIVSHINYFKCPWCKLEFVVLSWKSNWNEGYKPFCPECGKQECNFLGSHPSEKQIFQIKEEVLAM